MGRVPPMRWAFVAAEAASVSLLLACSAVPDIRFEERDAAIDGGSASDDGGDAGADPLCAAGRAAGAPACCGETACFGPCTAADCAACACAFGEFCCSRSGGGTSCRPATASTNVCR